MPFWRAYYHLVWTTKKREPLIQPEIERRLYGYLRDKAAELGVFVYAVNGWLDHVHLVVAIPPKHAVAYVVKRLKGASSFDLNQSGKLTEMFEWQRGYGALTLGETQLSRAIDYVNRQKEHHQKLSTNRWLEHVYEYDEGPVQKGEEDNGRLGEPSPVYSLDDSFPF